MSDLRRQGRLAALLRKRSRCRGRRIKSRMPAPKPTPFIAPPGTLGHACGLRRGASGENDVPSRGGTSSCTASGPGSHRRNRNRPRRAANRLRSTLCGPRSLASCCIAGLLRKSPDEQGCKANSRQNIARPAARRPNAHARIRRIGDGKLGVGEAVWCPIAEVVLGDRAGPVSRQRDWRSAGAASSNRSARPPANIKTPSSAHGLTPGPLSIALRWPFLYPIEGRIGPD
jgi:hypothetical protein